jgi:hypothetical protein
MTVQYQTIFDITTTGYQTWRFAAFGLIFVTIGILLVASVTWRRSLPFRWWSTRPLASKIFAYFFFGFALLWTSITFVGTWRDYSRLENAIATGHARVVEGVVTDFSPMPVTGHAMERFCVSGSFACFEYSDYVVTSGFNNTSSHGGPIRAGLRVRVTYVGDSILKLEVAKP